MRSRFGIIEHLEYYTETELADGVKRDARRMELKMSEEAALEIGKRSRGTMRIAKRLLRRVRDYADVAQETAISLERAKFALNELGIDHLGLDQRDRSILEAMINKFAGGPVGLDTLSTAVSEDKTTLEDVYEPFLIQKGFIQRTPRGRIVTEHAYTHLGYRYTPDPQNALFAELLSEDVGENGEKV